MFLLQFYVLSIGKNVGRIFPYKKKTVTVWYLLSVSVIYWGNHFPSSSLCSHGCSGKGEMCEEKMNLNYFMKTWKSIILV